MTRRAHATLATLSVLLAAACATPDTPLPTAQQLLATAESQVKSGEFAGALSTLAELEDERCPKRLRDRRDLAAAEAELGSGRPWQAFLVLERFSDLYPHSPRRGRAVDLLWRAGKTLIDSGGGFLFFWSDERAGRTVLEHLITRHPDTHRLADALRILGDMAFEDGDYELAQERYRDIIMNQPLSDWRYYAQFRFAMSIVASLRGPDYDLDRMEHAVRELRGFLANEPENPQMLEQSQRALAQVLEWQVQRHLDIADYYRTLGSDPGVHHHLKLAARPEFADVPSYQRAVDLLAEFEASRAEPAPSGGNP